jgi:hypothetical protein
VTALVFIAVGAAVSVALGVYGRVHTPTGQPVTTLGFESLIAMKVWLAAAAGALAVVQLLTALRMYGRIGSGPAPAALPMLHKASGAVTVVLTLPVAFHCLWSLGFQSYDSRVLAHSLLGCLFYGAFVTKVLAIHSRTAPRWLLPAAGGVVLTVLVLVVLTSSVWYLTAVGTP